MNNSGSLFGSQAAPPTPVSKSRSDVKVVAPSHTSSLSIFGGEPAPKATPEIEQAVAAAVAEVAAAPLPANIGRHERALRERWKEEDTHRLQARLDRMMPSLAAEAASSPEGGDQALAAIEEVKQGTAHYTLNPALAATTAEFDVAAAGREAARKAKEQARAGATKTMAEARTRAKAAQATVARSAARLRALPLRKVLPIAGVAGTGILLIGAAWFLVSHHHAALPATPAPVAAAARPTVAAAPAPAKSKPAVPVVVAPAASIKPATTTVPPPAAVTPILPKPAAPAASTLAVAPSKPAPVKQVEHHVPRRSVRKPKAHVIDAQTKKQLQELDQFFKTNSGGH